MVNQDWIEWKDLIDLGLKDFQFFDYLKVGLQPYKKHTRKAIHCPYEHHAYRHKLNRLEEIEWLLNSFTDLADLESKVEETKPYTFYAKHDSPFVEDFFSKYRNNVYMRPVANRGYPINSMILQKLKTCRDELTEEKSEIKNDELKAIVKDDPDLHSWRYFVLPSDKECEKIKSDLIEKAVFKKDAALNIKNELSITDLEIKKEQKRTVFPCEPGTKWEDIRITLISEETVRIKTPSSEDRSFGYSDLGLKYERNNKPKKLWTYLKAFAKAQGVISAKTFNDDPELKKDLIIYASKLNKHMQRFFGIEESIFTSHYKKIIKDKKPTKGYQTKIMFSDATQIVGTKPKTKEQSQSDEIGETFQKFAEHEKF